MGVVTSKGDALANRSLAHVGLAPYFQVVVGADRTERHKPDPDPIWFALRALDREPADAVYVGDSPFDVMAANAAGVTSVAVTWGASSDEPLRSASPQHVVTSVAELDTLLAKLLDG
jgi:pyrophosphatase PpaX